MDPYPDPQFIIFAKSEILAEVRFAQRSERESVLKAGGEKRE